MRHRQGVDDSAEEYRLGKAGGSQRQVGTGQKPAQSGPRPEHAQYARVQKKELHRIGNGEPVGLLPWCTATMITSHRDGT